MTEGKVHGFDSRVRFDPAGFDPRAVIGVSGYDYMGPYNHGAPYL